FHRALSQDLGTAAGLPLPAGRADDANEGAVEMQAPHGRVPITARRSTEPGESEKSVQVEGAVTLRSKAEAKARGNSLALECGVVEICRAPCE
ncbi:hypothetical protein, partial [Allorhizobium ampelinum]|uniref:hypothetical protein n=1 Tax=Allorhizobium ampelinum TaxID=3025782 RepID=UPI001F4570AD